jgi:hypothetical protein
MSYVPWAYQYYLARYPEDQNAVAWNENISQRRFDLMREHITASDEYKLSGGLFSVPPSKPGTFFAPRSRGPKICVLGNCQGPGIARAIAAIAAEPVSVCGIEIMEIAQTRDDMIGLVQGADYIIVCKVQNPEYKDVAPETIRETYGKDVMEFSPVHFTGLQPDIVVLGSFGKRIMSPLGGYNSRIILSSFLSGLRQDACVEAFNSENFERAGYFREFELSTKTMFAREKDLANGIRIADWFLDEIRRTPLLYTMNHPMSRVFVQFAAQVLDRIGIARHKVLPEFIANPLSGDVIWPVDSIIAQANGIGYDTLPLYWKNSVPLPRDEFIWRSYKAYESIDLAFLREAAGDQIVDLA